MTTDEKRYLKVLQQALDMSQGTMPIVVVAPNKEIMGFLNRKKKGKKHTKCVRIKC